LLYGYAVVRALASVALAALLFLVFDAAVFRSGFYLRYAEPFSTLGMLRFASNFVDQVERWSGAKPVLVIGDSRVTEGFSVLDASFEAYRLGGRLRFANGGVAGMPIKTAYYFTRWIDPRATRFRAIVMVIGSYIEDDFSPPNCEYELPYLHQLVTPLDIPWLIQGCTEPEILTKTAWVTAISALNFRLDFAAFLKNIPGRIAATRYLAEHGAEIGLTELGHQKTLAGLRADDKTIDWPPGADEETKQKIAGYVNALRHPEAYLPSERQAVERMRWLPRIVDRYHAAGVPVILVRHPRGPLHHHIPTEYIGPVIASLGDKVMIVPPETFRFLEQPQFYYDSLHLARPGRILFSEQLAREVAARLK
jgi:hypothetical protein